jgi:hypothetical protein
MEKIDTQLFLVTEKSLSCARPAAKIGGLAGVTETGKTYEAIIWCLSAYPRSSALVLMLSVSIIRYL